MTESAILTQAGIEDQILSDVFEELKDPTDPVAESAFMRGHDKLIVRGKAKGTWRLAPLPKLASDQSMGTESSELK